MESNLVKLRDLTERLRFSEIVRKPEEPEIIELEMEEGTSFMVGLYKDADIGVARNYVSAGGRFPEHDHSEQDSVEVLILYRGEMHLSVEGEVHIIKEKGEYYLLPGQRHSAYFPKDSWFIAITMPAADSWPRGG